MKSSKFRFNNNRTEKQLRKQVRKAERETAVDASPEIPIPTPMPRSPRKLLRGDVKFQTPQEKKKVPAKTSKRTTPGQFEAVSPPEHIQPEGKRWIKTVGKQEVSKSRRLSRKYTKQHIRFK